MVAAVGDPQVGVAPRGREQARSPIPEMPPQPESQPALPLDDELEDEEDYLEPEADGFALLDVISACFSSVTRCDDVTSRFELVSGISS